jgi:transcriptional regulator with XRE-family HTH domain
MARTPLPSLAAGFGPALRARREAVGLTQAQLHQKTGVATSYISAVERGLRQPTLPKAEELANALGLSLTALLEFAKG